MNNTSLLRNKLMIAVSAPSKHGKTESTQMLIDMLYLELITKREGWIAEIFNRKDKTFSSYTLTVPRHKDNFVVFSCNKEKKIAIITSGDNWSAPIIDCYQELVAPNDIRNVAASKTIQESYDIVVGCCHPNNNVKKSLEEIAKDSSYELIETSPFFQNPNITTASVKVPVYIWNYLFAKHLMDIILTHMGIHVKNTINIANSFSAQFTPYIFAMMENFRKSKGSFGYDIRKTNRNGRKEQGLIFYGNDDYIRVALSKEASEAMRSSTLGLVFVYDKETSQINCLLEVVCDNESKNLARYMSLVTSIAPLHDWKQIDRKDRYLMQLPFCKTADWLKTIVTARDFLNLHSKNFISNVNN